MKRRLLYVTGTRADFGLMRNALRRMDADPGVEISLCVVGQHLSRQFGLTAREVRSSGLAVVGQVRVDLTTGDGAMMAKAIGRITIGITDLLRSKPQDAVILLGDRGEMLAAALAAMHLNIPIFHIHGGERTGTVDEPIRHAISKLAHYHLAATADARTRLVRMGEDPRHVFVAGAPGLDDIKKFKSVARGKLFKTLAFSPARPLALVLFHPVLQEAEQAGTQMRTLLETTLRAGYQILCLEPNSDAGNRAVLAAIGRLKGNADLRAVTHLPRDEYLSWLAAADVLVGNSSSGIIEAASFGLPVVNIGSRQQGRLRGANVLDSSANGPAILRALKKAAGLKGRRFKNPYGDGRAGKRIARLVAKLPLDRRICNKSNSY